MRRYLLALAVLVCLLLALPAQAQAPYAIYLPALAQADLRNLSPAPAANEVYVRSVHIQRPVDEYWNLVGEVINPTAEPVFHVQLVARFLNASGQQVAVADTEATLARIGPGQRSPFQLYVGNPPGTATAFTLAITHSPDSSLAWRDAIILSAQTRDNLGVEIFGEVRNPEVLELRGVMVAATFYDLAGHVVDVESRPTSPLTIAAGATAVYVLPTYDETLTNARMEVQAQGYLGP
jgi:hypothetical protein